MIKHIRTAAGILAAAAVLVMLAGWLFSLPASASTAGASTQDARTCAAWDGHRVPAEVYADSRRAHWFIRSDVTGWYDRWRRHDRSTAAWARYVSIDCATRNGYGQ